MVCRYFRHTTGRIKVYQAADLSTFLLRPVCFRPTSCTSAMMELMPCATHSRLWCGFDMPFHPGCHRPFHHSVVLRSITSAVVGFALLFKDFFSCARFPRSYCFSMSYSVRLHSSALRPVFYQLARTGCLRKVRDSNPRIVLTIAALAVRCFQPDSANLPCARLCGR